MTKKTTMLFTTLAATGAGYAAGVLLAPKSGAEIRQNLRAKMIHANNATKGRVEQSKQTIRRLQARAEQKVREMREKPGEPATPMSGEKGPPGEPMSL